MHSDTKNHDYFLVNILYTVSCNVLKPPSRKGYTSIYRHICKFCTKQLWLVQMRKEFKHCVTVTKTEPSDITLLNQPISVLDNVSATPSPPASYDWQTIRLTYLTMG